MMSIDMKIYFKDKEPLELSSNCFSNLLIHWNLRSNDVISKYNFIFTYPFYYSYTMSPKEFLELVGSNIDEAKRNILKENSSLTTSMVNEAITMEVRSFYKLIKTKKLTNVEFSLVDQS